MRQSTPLNQLDSIDVDNDQKDENVQDVLQSINETFQSPQMPSPTPPPSFLPSLPQNMDQYAPVQLPTEGTLSTDNEKVELLSMLTYEVKLALLSATIFIIVCFVPIEQFVFKYAALEKIPFANVYIKAVIAGFLFYFLVRIIA